MLGKELYNKLSKRDFSESTEDCYAQELQTMFTHLNAAGQLEGLYKMLEKANSLNKKLIIINSNDDLRDEYTLNDISIS